MIVVTGEIQIHKHRCQTVFIKTQNISKDKFYFKLMFVTREMQMYKHCCNCFLKKKYANLNFERMSKIETLFT